MDEVMNYVIKKLMEYVDEMMDYIVEKVNGLYR